jgi:hypothetical protein
LNRPFVVLLEQDSSQETVDGVLVSKDDADHLANGERRASTAKKSPASTEAGLSNP